MPRGAHLRPDGVRERFDERRLPGAREPDRLRKDRRVARHQPGADLLVDDRRDAEPRVVDEMALDRVRELRRLRRAQAARAGDARTWPIPSFSSWSRRASSAVGVGELEDPAAPELRDLLLERHACEQVVDALGDRPRRVAVEPACPGRPWTSSCVLPERSGTSRARRASSAARPAPAALDGSRSVRAASDRLLTHAVGSDWSIVVSGGSQSADSGTLSKPIDREVVGHAEPERARDGDRLDRRCVVRREDRGRPRLAQQQLARRARAPSRAGTRRPRTSSASNGMPGLPRAPAR